MTMTEETKDVFKELWGNFKPIDKLRAELWAVRICGPIGRKRRQTRTESVKQWNGMLNKYPKFGNGKEVESNSVKRSMYHVPYRTKHKSTWRE